jgi:formyltetrahydrofolate synthetase
MKSYENVVLSFKFIRVFILERGGTMSKELKEAIHELFNGVLVKDEIDMYEYDWDLIEKYKNTMAKALRLQIMPLEELKQEIISEFHNNSGFTDLLGNLDNTILTISKDKYILVEPHNFKFTVTEELAHKITTYFMRVKEEIK